ncbi:MAG: hypothetical protein U9R33_00630 [candidate division NC10 bacterium]|nr:hypothetical protein [candidate division NC10 bacterium]
MASWRFRFLKKEKGHRGLLMEGRASREGSPEEVEFFLLIGPDYGTADVHSLRAESFALIDYFADFLGQPLREPHPVNIGELMDSEDEIPVNGFWHIRADQRDAIVAELLQAVERQEMRDG